MGLVSRPPPLVCRSITVSIIQRFSVNLCSSVFSKFTCKATMLLFSSRCHSLLHTERLPEQFWEISNFLWDECLIAAKSRLLQQSLLMVLCMPGVLDQLPSLASWLDLSACWQAEISRIKVYEGTLLGTNMSPQKGTFESMFFRTSQGGICDPSLEGAWWSQDIIPPISASEINLTNCRWIIYVQKIGCMERFDYLWRYIHLVSNFRVLEGKGLFCFHKTALFIMVISSRKNY